MKHSLRLVIAVVIAAILLIVGGWIVTVALFKSGGRTEEPHQLALRLSR